MPWYNGLIDYDPNKYQYSMNTERLVNASDYRDPWVSNIEGLGNRYRATVGNT
jgi:hypothetical protein